MALMDKNKHNSLTIIQSLSSLDILIFEVGSFYLEIDFVLK